VTNDWHNREEEAFFREVIGHHRCPTSRGRDPGSASRDPDGAGGGSPVEDLCQQLLQGGT
jgi:hypothetical protein